MNNYMNDHELRTRLNLSRSTLWKLRKNGLPHTRIGGSIRYSPDEVEEWLRDQCNGTPVNNYKQRSNNHE